MAEVLTREKAIPELMTPTGRKLGVRYFPPNPNLVEVVFADSKPGELPDKLKGLYTKKALALQAVNKYLEEFWDTSDSKKK